MFFFCEGNAIFMYRTQVGGRQLEWMLDLLGTRDQGVHSESG